MLTKEEIKIIKQANQDSFSEELEKRRNDKDSSKPPFLLVSNIPESEKKSIIKEVVKKIKE